MIALFLRLALRGIRALASRLASINVQFTRHGLSAILFLVAAA